MTDGEQKHPLNKTIVLVAELTYIWKMLENRGFPKDIRLFLFSLCRKSTHKQFDLAWKNFIFWCNKWNKPANKITKKELMSYLFSIFKKRKFYPTINTHKLVAVAQT